VRGPIRESFIRGKTPDPDLLPLKGEKECRRPAHLTYDFLTRSRPRVDRSSQKLRAMPFFRV
jgi:hypothetical protein